jgi:hypothetical protein
MRLCTRHIPKQHRTMELQSLPCLYSGSGQSTRHVNDTCRSVTARARRPHQEERQKWPRRGPKHRKNFATKSANESAAPSSMKRARKGTATKPIQIPSSSEGGKHSSDDSESEGASSSDVALAGFHYSSGYSHDSYPSSDM